MSGQSALPILKEGRNIVDGSAAIIDYLDKEFPRFPLTPESSDEREAAIEWECWADSEIGPASRVLAYSVLIERPDLLKPVMAQDGAWYASFYLNKAFPKIQYALKKGLKLDEQNIGEARNKLHRASERILAAQSEMRPILESGFSRADLAIASLWAPLFNIGKYGLQWPTDLPDDYLRLADEFQAVRPWVEHIYAKYR